MINISKLAAAARATAKPKTVPASPDLLDQEKLTRRAALRRIGMTSGIAVLGLLTIDDLARVSAKKLEQHELTRGIAKDFKSAGVAFADTLGGGGYGDDYDECERNEVGAIVWLAAGQCKPKPKPIPIPDSCINGVDGERPDCNQCASDYYRACEKKAWKKGLIGGAAASEVCRHANTLCQAVTCSADDSVAAVKAYAECYQKATKEV